MLLIHKNHLKRAAQMLGLDCCKMVRACIDLSGRLGDEDHTKLVMEGKKPFPIGTLVPEKIVFILGYYYADIARYEVLPHVLWLLNHAKENKLISEDAHYRMSRLFVAEASPPQYLTACYVPSNQAVSHM